MSQLVSHEWSKDALFAKAQRFAEEMLKNDPEDWRFGLWSAFLLEILSRAALASVSPTLLADGKEWGNIMYALGTTPNIPKFNPRSTDITEVLKRLEIIFPAFTKDMMNFASAHLNKRNAEIHSGDLAFDGVGSSKWLPAYYGTISVLTGIVGETLQTLLGSAEAQNAETQIAALHDENAQSVKKTINAHRVLWDEKDESERKKLTTQADLLSPRHAGHRVRCPACNSVALVEGRAVGPPKTTIDDGYVVEKQTMRPDKFKCVGCLLNIVGFAKLLACGLGDTYTAERHYDAVDYFGIDL